MLLHAATRIVGVSRQVVLGALADGVKPNRTRVIYNGIDLARLTGSTIDLRAKLGIAQEAFVVVTVGSLVTGKGHDVLIRAFHDLPAGTVCPHLIILGGGGELGALRELAAGLGIIDRVHFVGQVQDVVQGYKAADVFALASRAEAFGLVLAEAGYFGLPAVSTRVGGIPEVVLHGQTGLLTSADNVPAFAGALARLMNDPALRHRMGAAARARAEDNFTASRMARQFESVYAELVATPRKELGWISMVRNLANSYFKLL